MRPAHSLSWSRLLLLLALPGCLVSFNDYPLDEPKGDAASSAGSGAGGKVSVPPGAGRGGSAATGSGAEAGASDVAPLLSNQGLIDDFEDGDAAIVEKQGRSGSWYVANDGRGVQTPPAGVPALPAALMPARGTSSRGAHTFGGPFSTWGALIGTALAVNGSNPVAYDLSGHRGVRFWVRSGAIGPGAAKKVRLNVLTPATIVGGGCTVCTDHFGADIPLTAQWVQIDVPLASLKQTGYGQPMLSTPDLAHAMGLELLFAVGVSFDLWIDDLELY